MNEERAIGIGLLRVVAQREQGQLVRRVRAHAQERRAVPSIAQGKTHNLGIELHRAVQIPDPQRYVTEAGVTARPATLDQYVSQVIVPTLQRQKRAG